MPQDPPTDSEDRCPYDVLAAVGVSPASSMTEVLDSSYELMRDDRWTPETRSAWNALRIVEDRLVADFLCTEVAARDPRLRALCDAFIRYPKKADLEYDR